MSDGEVSVPVVLSDAAWEAYDKGIAEEEGDEPRKGDLLICKRIVVVSTHWGPIDERITFRVDELEYAGNIRKPIGTPTPLLQRPSIVVLLEKIENIALGNHHTDVMEEAPAPAQAPAPAPAQSEQTDGGASADIDMETVIDADPDVLSDAAPIPSLDPQQAREHEEEQTIVEVPSPLPTHTSPIVSRSSAQFQIDTQLEVEATQARAPPTQARNPIRRNRGGYSMGREGFEMTRGDNLTGPQAPNLHPRRSSASAEPPKANPPQDKLLNLLSKLPGQQPRNCTPEPSAPVSAQQEVTVGEVVVETPAKKKISLTTIAGEDDAAPAPARKPSVVVISSETKRKRRRPSPTPQESTSAPRRIYRIPKNQQALLDDQSSWLPPAPGHNFPHPNVPVKLLSLWNTKAGLDTNSPSQLSPIALIERSSGEKSVEELQMEEQAAESESDSEELMSADELIEWSQSQSRSQALPPDSSAGPASSAHTARLGSRDGATPTQGQVKPRTNDLSGTPKGSRGKPTPSRSQIESPKPATVAPHQSVDLDDRALHATSLAKLNQLQSDAQSLNKVDSNAGRITAQETVASQSASSSRQDATTPAGLSRPQASPAMSQAANQRSSQHPRAPASGANARPVQRQNQQRPATTPLASQPTPTGSGANARPAQRQGQQRPAATPVASQPTPTGSKMSAPLADNHRGPIQASTQQTPHRAYRPSEPKMSSSSATPSGAPTAPRAIRDARHSLPNRSFSGSSRGTPDPKSLPYNGFYAPQPSGQRRETLPAGSQKDNGDFYRPQPSGQRRETLPAGSQKDNGDFYRHQPSGQSRDTLPAGSEKKTPPSRPKNGTPPSRTSRQDPSGTQASEMETSVPRSLPPNEHHQERSRYMRGAQRRYW